MKTKSGGKPRRAEKAGENKRSAKNTSWKSYEEAAAFLAGQFKQHLGLEGVEGKEKVRGKSGTDYEIDAKGTRIGGEIIIIESRKTKSRQRKKDLGDLAWRIIDTGAAGGIIVSPLPLQKGAKQIAAAKGIVEVTINAECTTTDYVMAFLNQIMVGASDSCPVMDDSVATVVRAVGDPNSDETVK